MNEIVDFISSIKKSIEAESFIKITLSKPTKQAVELQKIYVRLILIKNATNLSFTYHFKTNDQVKNFLLEDAYKELATIIAHTFQHCTLFTTEMDVSLRISKKGKGIITEIKPSFIEKSDVNHDRQKVKRAVIHDAYLTALGIVDEYGEVIPKMADKFKQINKYLEVIESLIKSTPLPVKINIVDMGSGKGYLTFALYDFLKIKLGLDVHVTGIELRKELVDYCNDVAVKCGFDNLKFKNGSIEQFHDKHVDIVIALHACDTATDDALAKAIQANAALIVCAPCCHKQIRQQIKGRELDNPIMKYGIFKERQLEMVTDTLRALILEKKHYDTKIFEFISNEHTRKNVLLVGSKNSRRVLDNKIDDKINAIKAEYHIDYHHLEKLID